VVPLVVEEPTSSACRALLRTDPVQIVWCLTRTEVLSALWRRHRRGGLGDAVMARATDRLDRLGLPWAEVDAVALVREQAERMLRVHPLRAADALQLAAALVAFDGRVRGRAFVSLDDELGAAAAREGFDTVAPRR
jgi:predicted nucleic acid-binding protein